MLVYQEVSGGGDQAGAFLREASTWAQMNHPNVVQLLGVCRSKPMMLICEVPYPLTSLPSLTSLTSLTSLASLASLTSLTLLSHAQLVAHGALNSYLKTQNASTCPIDKLIKYVAQVSIQRMCVLLHC
jgi:hypothetical protein